MDLAACSFSQEQIAVGLGIPLRTLARHFAEEIAHGKARVHAEIAGSIVEAARNGDRTMRIFVAKTQLGWRERTSMAFEDDKGALVNPNTFTIRISGLDDP
jgi:hypothetical protein